MGKNHRKGKQVREATVMEELQQEMMSKALEPEQPVQKSPTIPVKEINPKYDSKEAKRLTAEQLGRFLPGEYQEGILTPDEYQEDISIPDENPNWNEMTWSETLEETTIPNKVPCDGRTIKLTPELKSMFDSTYSSVVHVADVPEEIKSKITEDVNKIKEEVNKTKEKSKPSAKIVSEDIFTGGNDIMYPIVEKDRNFIEITKDTYININSIASVKVVEQYIVIVTLTNQEEFKLSSTKQIVLGTQVMTDTFSEFLNNNILTI